MFNQLFNQISKQVGCVNGSCLQLLRMYSSGVNKGETYLIVQDKTNSLKYLITTNGKEHQVVSMLE